jgi:hypothetical protein
MRYSLCSALIFIAAAIEPAGAQRGSVVFPNTVGLMETNGKIVLQNAFFRDLGANGRACATCHQLTDGMSVTPNHIELRFQESGGSDPIFRPVDGANCDSLDVSTLTARQSAYSLLLNKGLIRVAIDVPANADFKVIGVENPYGCSSRTTLSIYRRPLPATNLRFLSTVMWDGRESLPGKTLHENLKHQANSATLGHAQGSALSDALQEEIVQFEMGLHTAQAIDFGAGMLSVSGARGGPAALSLQQFFIGINDPLGQNPTGAKFDSSAFKLFEAWLGQIDSRRQSIARGERIFNTRPILIAGVAGLNDIPGLASVSGTCTTCHDSPNVGNHSVPLAIDIGVNDVARRTPDLPVFTLQRNGSTEVIRTLDPGRALITGKWADIGKTKGPILRGLAARAPYFHNGSAATLLDVVNFYETRFSLGLTVEEKNDLVLFLSAL